MIINKEDIQFSPAQCKMARAGLGMGIRDLAKIAECAPATIVKFEGGGSLHKRTIMALKETLEEAGVRFYIADDGREGVELTPNAEQKNKEPQ